MNLRDHIIGFGGRNRIPEPACNSFWGGHDWSMVDAQDKIPDNNWIHFGWNNCRAVWIKHNRGY